MNAFAGDLYSNRTVKTSFFRFFVFFVIMCAYISPDARSCRAHILHCVRAHIRLRTLLNVESKKKKNQFSFLFVFLFFFESFKRILFHDFESENLQMYIRCVVSVCLLSTTTTTTTKNIYEKENDYSLLLNNITNFK